MAAKKVTEESTKAAEVVRKKSTVSYEEMLRGFHNIPRKATIGKSVAESFPQSVKPEKCVDKSEEKAREKKAVKDMKRLLVLLEKSMIGETNEKDLQEITNTGQWLESIAVLKEYVETLEY